MTVQEQTTPSPAEHDTTDTEVLAVAPPSPVFVDSSGRRRRLLRRIAYGFIAVCMLYGGLICVSLAGGPVNSSAILPLPELGGSGDDAPDTPPSPAPAPTTNSPAPRALVEALPRQHSAPTKGAGTAPQPSTTPNQPVTAPAPTSSPSPSPRASTTRPVESTTTPAPTSPATTGTSAPAPTDSPSTPASPVAPAPPGTGTGSASGSGGSAGSGGSGDPVGTGVPTTTPSSVEASS